MRGYLRQIDSLNTLNKNLIKENVSYRKEISSANLRAEVAEEKASELDTKVRQGAVIRARGHPGSCRSTRATRRCRA